MNYERLWKEFGEHLERVASEFFVAHFAEEKSTMLKTDYGIRYMQTLGLASHMKQMEAELINTHTPHQTEG